MACKVSNLMDVIELFRERYPEITAPTIMTFFFVTQKPGISIGDIATKLNMSQPAASRNVFVLSKWKAAGVPGLDLIEAHENPENRREKQVNLTSKGERFVEAINKALVA
jgi:DNA-binding MarR family transcriptional regulator